MPPLPLLGNPHIQPGERVMLAIRLSRHHSESSLPGDLSLTAGNTDDTSEYAWEKDQSTVMNMRCGDCNYTWIKHYNRLPVPINNTWQLCSTCRVLHNAKQVTSSGWSVKPTQMRFSAKLHGAERNFLREHTGCGR